jgi:GT2 family glycosyltransferase
VVDNHSCDGLAQLLTAFPHQTRIITAPENLGYGKGMNLGAAALDLQPGDFLLFLTHEVSLKESCVNQLIHTALSTNAALVGPVLRRSRDQSVWSVGGYLDRLGIPRHYTAIHDSDQISSNVQWLDGAVLACRASDFKARNSGLFL